MRSVQSSYCLLKTVMDLLFCQKKNQRGKGRKFFFWGGDGLGEGKSFRGGCPLSPSSKKARWVVAQRVCVKFQKRDICHSIMLEGESQRDHQLTRYKPKTLSSWKTNLDIRFYLGS